ncbi:DEAD/DEAH box helicase family protein [Flavobacterium sp.]|uniref:DEAD/DEAH box helicase family protein n=1 Tax=Flavobacterium sp. TaxID=239 RepID=UPI00260CAA36|nr:DEAD/DEAH box helicase family protein [Flavobacterium sp.]
MSFKSVLFPKTLKISSSGEMIPLEFFGEVIPLAKKIQFKLGFFSSNSISTLSYGFAQFIYNGGTIDFLINHFLSDGDYKLMNDGIFIDESFYDSIEEKILRDLERLNEVLTKKQVNHFYNCLRYLIDNNRVTITPVTTKSGEISHYKEALFWDYDDNVINIIGSCNFTYKGIACNGESFLINRSWGETAERANIENEILDYEKMFQKQSDAFIYLKPDKLINIVYDNSVSLSEKDLLQEELDLIEAESNEATDEVTKLKTVNKKLQQKFEEKVTEMLSKPRFPRPNEPRPYQNEAYKNWVNNNFTGIFGMATGTGKTKTSLNCVLNEYKKTNSYYALILVPSIALLNQWEEEVVEFNFQNILKIGGGNYWEKEFSNYVSNFSAGIKTSLVIIATYASFTSLKFQKYFNKVENEFILIADEAHNMGAKNIKAAVKNSQIQRRIGLSATPKRVYDVEGTEFIDKFFNDKEPYTYNFSMKQAMEMDFLTNYKYYPVLVELNEEELDNYIEISKRLLRYFDFDKGEFKKDPMVEKLLLLRKNIIHKANNKIKCFKNILIELRQMNKVKYIFTYIPEGYVYDENGGSERMLNKFLLAGHDVLPSLKMNSYIAEGQNLNDLLRGFSEGKIDMLFAMKMLDEGVDVPRAEVGIFASSTGNPRQFIQRRGRLLRKHKDKPYATIFDMVVVPRLNDNNAELFNMERNLVHNELRRVGYFASLALNFYDSKQALEQVCFKYNLDLDTIINEL